MARIITRKANEMPINAALLTTGDRGETKVYVTVPCTKALKPQPEASKPSIAPSAGTSLPGSVTAVVMQNVRIHLIGLRDFTVLQKRPPDVFGQDDGRAGMVESAA